MKQNKMGINGKILIITIIVLCGCETKENGFEYVDLGLPSGTLWATCNVGAEHPYDVGDYFAWGETQPKERFGWDNYKYISSDSTITKYVFYPKSPYYDTLRILEPCDDAATANMGGRWVTPTYSEFLELRLECDHYDTNNYKGSGISGTIFTSKHNGKSIFLPHEMDYWSSNLDEELIKWDYGYDALRVQKESDKATGVICAGEYRFYGRQIRGVVRGKSIDYSWICKDPPDPIEDSPAYKNVIFDVMEEVLDSLRKHPDGNGHRFWFWEWQKMILKRHGIDWKMPPEMDPDSNYD